MSSSLFFPDFNFCTCFSADWIKTINAVERSCTTDISSNQSLVASAQTPPSPKHSTPNRKLSLKKRDSVEQSVGGKTRERKSRGRRRKRGGVPSVGAECEGVSGGEGEEVNPMSLTPVDRGKQFSGAAIH